MQSSRSASHRLLSLTFAVVWSLFEAMFRSISLDHVALGCVALEMLAGEVICALMDIDNYPEPEGVNTGVQGIQGPTPVLVGHRPTSARSLSQRLSQPA